MAIQPFLAFVPAEMENREIFPEKTAWLGCHFSPSGPGLSNLPTSLPSKSLLILDDANPIQGHDPALIARQAADITAQMDCAAVLLDFQRRSQEGAAEMARVLVETLSCPVAVSALYAADLDCPVFLPPVCPSIPLKDALWKGRECWLELALDGETITLTEQGAAVSAIESIPEEGFAEKNLHCHYALELTEHQAKWTLWRTREDLDGLLEEAAQLGVTNAVGLWQEMQKPPCFRKAVSSNTQEGY